MSEQPNLTEFKDKDGDAWRLQLTFADREPLREDGFDLFKVFEDNFAGLAAVTSDPERLVRILYLLLEDQLEAKGVTPEAFAKRLNGAALEAAAVAFARAVVDFFPEPRRGVGHAMLDKGLEAVPAMGKAIRDAIQSLPVDSLRDESNDSPGSAPTSLEPSPTLSASAS